MQYKKFKNKYIVRIDQGEEIVETLKQFCRDKNIRLGSISGIGATNRATIGFFETKTKEYHSKEFNGDFEITFLMGNITTMDNKTYLHLHINIADEKQNTFGGHLNSAVVSAACEIVVDVIDGEVSRKFDEEIGLNLMKFD